MSTNPNDASARRRKILFTDWRDIDSGSVAWLTAAGERYRVGNPPGEPVALWAEQPSVPRGIRLQAQPARKAGMIEGTPDVGHVLYEEGRYRSWYLEVNGISRFGTGAPAHRRPAGAGGDLLGRIARRVALGRPDPFAHRGPRTAGLRRHGVLHRPARQPGRALQVHILRQVRRRRVPIAPRRLPAPRAAPPGRAHVRRAAPRDVRGRVARRGHLAQPAGAVHPAPQRHRHHRLLGRRRGRVRDVHAPVPRRPALDRPRRGKRLRALGARRADHLAASGRSAGLRLLPQRPQPLPRRARSTG